VFGSIFDSNAANKICDATRSCTVALLLEQSLEVQRIILALPQARKIIKADRVNTEIGAEGSSIGRGE
jgi:hypothetical protein